LAVLEVMKYEVPGDKLEAYSKWSEGAVKRLLIPPLIEFRAYRPVVGASLAVIIGEFADLAAWAAWRSNKEIERVYGELLTFAVSVTSEVWGPSPVVPKPIRL